MVILNTLPDVIRAFQYPGGLNVRRLQSSGQNEFGEDAEPVFATFRLDPVVIQPLEGRDLLRVPEGDRDRERVLLHTCQLLRTARGGSDIDADVVLYDPARQGTPFEYVVETAEPWVVQAGMWRCRALRKETDR